MCPPIPITVSHDQWPGHTQRYLQAMRRIELDLSAPAPKHPAPAEPATAGDPS